MQNPERDGGVHERDHDGARLRESRSEQRLLPARVAIDNGRVVARRFAHALRIGVESDERDVLGLEQAHQILAAAAVAADDHVILAGHRRRRDPGDLRRARKPVVGRELAHDRVREMDQQRGRKHRQQHRREHDLPHRARHERQVDRDCEHHQRELAGLREIESGTQCGSGRRPEQARQHDDQRKFRDDRNGEQQKHPCEVVGDDGKIERHPDGDEEQPQQHVAKRLDVLFDLIAVLGLRNEHAREERAERERQSGELRERRQAERDQEQVQHEELGTALAGDEVEPGAHWLLPGEQDQHQHDQCLHAGLGQRHGELPGAPAERRHDDQERDDRQILEQENAHHVPPMRGREFHPLGKHLGNDCRRTHRQGPAQRESRRPAKAQKLQREHTRDGGDRHLHETESEHDSAHRLELRQAEFESDREHQEDDAELGEMAGLGRLRHPRERVRTHGDADQQVAENRRQADETADDDDNDRCPEQHQDQLQRLRHRAGVAVARPAAGGSAIECSMEPDQSSPVYFCA